MSTPLREFQEDEDCWWYAYDVYHVDDGDGEVRREMHLRVYAGPGTADKTELFLPDPPEDVDERRQLAHNALLVLKLGRSK